jgi:hypothetical protein
MYHFSPGELIFHRETGHIGIVLSHESLGEVSVFLHRGIRTFRPNSLSRVANVLHINS